MGSDTSPLNLFQGILQAAKEYGPPYFFDVIADNPTLQSLTQLHFSHDHIQFHAAQEVITMTDDPLKAIREKKHSSLMVGMRLLKEQHLDAFISAGNTGALISAAKILLPMLPAIRRPALLAQLPTTTRTLSMIDAGGNIRNTPYSLIQYAQMGIAYQRCCTGVDRPVVGLLNIGVEATKGPPLLRETHTLLQSLSKSTHKFQFIGNIEARDLFNGRIDVLVTDGFTGNVLLKAVEGTAKHMIDCLAQHLPHPIKEKFSYTEYPGALVCGVDRILIKCHGNASQQSIYSAICAAIKIDQKQLISYLRADLTI